MSYLLFYFFFNDTATTEIYTLSLHDALPIYVPGELRRGARGPGGRGHPLRERRGHDGPAELRGPGGQHGPPDPAPHRRPGDRKSTRLNSSHANISYAVFCLKKKKTIIILAHI